MPLSPSTIGAAATLSQTNANSAGDWGANVPGTHGAATLASASPTGVTLAAMNAQGISPTGNSALLDPGRSRRDVIQTQKSANKFGMGPLARAINS